MNRISGELHADSLLKRGRDFIPVAILVAALFALLALSVWFAAYAWTHLGGDPIPSYGYVAIAGGVVVSLLVGGGLMALVFYSSRHGYDDLSGGEACDPAQDSGHHDSFRAQWPEWADHAGNQTIPFTWRERAK